MKEYTILSVLSVLIVCVFDRRLKTGILKSKAFWSFILVIAFFKILVNGYLTSSGIVKYGPGFFLGLRLTSIPLEDFLFGFSMVLTAIMTWELFKKES
jgi:lycopene cyclase domain-containing protein